MTAHTKKIRNYLRMLEDIALVVGGCEDEKIAHQAAFRVKGFAREIETERLAMAELRGTLNKINEHELLVKTILHEFPQLEHIVRGK